MTTARCHSDPLPIPLPEAAMTPDDKELRETLDLLSQVVASVSDRLDAQAETLDRLAQNQAQAVASPDRVAAATSESLRALFMPDMTRLVDVMEELTGKKAVLRERLRALDCEDAREGRWRTHPVALVVGIPLALTLVLGLPLPRAMAETPLTCRAMGGAWQEPVDQLPATCIFWMEGRG